MRIMDWQSIEDWKQEKCFNKNSDLCQECCSGGSLLGCMCRDKMKYFSLNENGQLYLKI